MTDKELWEKSQVWESSDDGRGKLKILESVEKFAELVRADEREIQAEAFQQILAATRNVTRADEREACADLCYQLVDNLRETRFAAAIRARSNT